MESLLRGIINKKTLFGVFKVAALATLISPVKAETVLYNPLENTSGGSQVNNSGFKALVFQTGNNPTKLNSITLGINPFTGSGPTTAKVTITLWSVNASGQPVSPIKTLVNSSSISISSTARSYSFAISASDSLLLNAKTKYALVLSSDTVGIRWANNTSSLSPVGENGYLYQSFLTTADSGSSWSTASSDENTILAEVFTIPYNEIMPQSYAGFLSVGLETLKRQREVLLSESGLCEQNGFNLGKLTADRQVDQPKKQSKLSSFCFNALAVNSTSYINGNSELFSYQSGITSGFYILEYRSSPRLKLGLAYGNGTSYLNSMPQTNASITSSVNSGSLYGVFNAAPNLLVRGLLGYAYFASHSTRNVSYLDNGTEITSSPNANGYTAAIDAKYFIAPKTSKGKSPFYLAPKLGLAWGGYSQEAFSETGVEYLNLKVDSHTANSVIGTVSTEFGTQPIALSRGSSLALRPKIAVGYQVDMLGNASDEMTLSQSFAAAPSAGSVSVQGQNRGVNNVYVEGGLELLLGSTTSLYAMTSLESFSTGSQFNYSGGIRIAF